MTAILLLKRFWPVLAGAVLVIGVLMWGNSREAAGVRKERAAWETEAARLRAIAATEAQERAAAVLRADTAEAARRAALARKLAPIIEKVTVYEKTDAGRAVCLDDAGRLLAQEAVTAANADIAAAARKRR